MVNKKTPVQGSLFAYLWVRMIIQPSLHLEGLIICPCTYWQLSSFGQIYRDRFSGRVLPLYPSFVLESCDRNRAYYEHVSGNSVRGRHKPSEWGAHLSVWDLTLRGCEAIILLHPVHIVWPWAALVMAPIVTCSSGRWSFVALRWKDSCDYLFVPSSLLCAKCWKTKSKRSPLWTAPMKVVHTVCSVRTTEYWIRSKQSFILSTVE